MAASSKKKRVFCDHCQQMVGYSTFYRHRDRFYDAQSSSWGGTTAADGNASSDSSCPSSSDIDIDHIDGILELASFMVEVDCT